MKILIYTLSNISIDTIIGCSTESINKLTNQPLNFKHLTLDFSPTQLGKKMLVTLRRDIADEIRSGLLCLCNLLFVGFSLHTE